MHANPTKSSIGFLAAPSDATLTALCAKHTSLTRVQWNLRPFGPEFMGRVWVDEMEHLQFRRTHHYFHTYFRSPSEVAVRVALALALEATEPALSPARAAALLSKSETVVIRKIDRELKVKINRSSPLEHFSVWVHPKSREQVRVSSVNFGEVRVMYVGRTLETDTQREPSFVSNFRLLGVEQLAV